MKTRSIPVAAGIALILVSSARGEFVPGRLGNLPPATPRFATG